MVVCDILSKESTRGIITSISLTMIAFLTELGFISLNVDQAKIYAFHDLIIGNFFAFVLDIVFASSKGVKALAEKKYIIGLVLDSLATKTFTRFAITVLIDVMISVPLFQFVNSQFEIGIYGMKIVKSIINITTFFVFINKIRFEWAYKSNNKSSISNLSITMFSITLSFLFLAMSKMTPTFKYTIVTMLMVFIVGHDNINISLPKSYQRIYGLVLSLSILTISMLGMLLFKNNNAIDLQENSYLSLKDFGLGIVSASTGILILFQLKKYISDCNKKSTETHPQ